MNQYSPDQKNKIVSAVLQSIEDGTAVYKAARAAGINEVTFWRWRTKDKALNTKVEGIYESRVQNVEDALYRDALTKGNTVAKIFFLKNRAMHRWKDRHEIRGEGIASQSLTLILPDGMKPEIMERAKQVARNINGAIHSETETS